MTNQCQHERRPGGMLRRLQHMSLRRVLHGLKPRRIDMLLYEGRPAEDSAPDSLVEITVELYRGDRKSGAPSIDGRLREFRECYAVTINGEIVHQSWVIYDVLLPGRFGFDPTRPVVGECHTLASARGKRIYPTVLREIARDLERRGVTDRVYLLVATDNVASIKGVERAGYARIARLRGWNIAGMVLRKQRTA